MTGTTSNTGFFSDNAKYQLIDNGSNGLLLAEVITFSGVKLLNETGGEEMTGGKIYDGKAVAYDDSGVSYTPTVLGVSLTYTWQKLNGETYSDLTAAPKAAGSYRLLVSAVKNGNTLGTQVLAFTISPKPLTVENLKVADKTYDGTDKAKIIGTPTLNDFVGTDDVRLVLGTPSFTSMNVGENIAIRFTEFTLTGTDKSNYTLIQPSGITASITAYSADGTEYSVNSNDWLNVDFVVTAADGWQLSYTNTADGSWVESLTRSEETGSGSLRFYVRNKTSGIISEVITEPYKIDKTPPVISGIEDGKFYCEDITITAEDENFASWIFATIPQGSAAVTVLPVKPFWGQQIRVAAEDKARNITVVTVNIGHDWGEWTSNGDDTHTRVCSVNAKHTETDDCHGGTATCKDRAVCDDCKQPYGELDPKNHTNLQHFPAKVATTTSEGNIEYWYCDGCGRYFSDRGATQEIQIADTVIARLKDSSQSAKTGDNSNLTLWIVLLSVSGAAAIGVLIVSRKKKSRK